MNIKEIALKVWYSRNECMPADGMNKLTEFAEALVAELTKESEPVGWYSKQYGFCYMHKQPDQFKVGSILYLKDGTPAWRIESTCSKTALINMEDIPHGAIFYEEVTLPLTASQIANEERVEQETAEAFARYFDNAARLSDMSSRTFSRDFYIGVAGIARSGEYRKFMKGE